MLAVGGVLVGRDSPDGAWCRRVTNVTPQVAEKQQKNSTNEKERWTGPGPSLLRISFGFSASQPRLLSLSKRFFKRLDRITTLLYLVLALVAAAIATAAPSPARATRSCC